MQGIDKKSASFAAMTEKYQMIDTILAGTDAIKDAKQKYLPKFELETDLSYKTRIETAVLENIFEDGVRNISSKPFTNGILINNVPSTFEVDDLVNEAESKFQRAVTHGECFVVIEYAEVDEDATLADTMAIKPYIFTVDNLSILAAEEEQGRLVHFRYKTTALERNGFEYIEYDQIVCYDIGTINVYKKPKNDKDYTLVDEIITGLDCLPVVRIQFGRDVVGQRPKPPLLDAAYKQIEHYQLSVGLRHIMDLACYPMLAGQGMEGGQTAIASGANAVLYAPEGSKWEILEPTCASMEFTQKRIEAVERSISVLCLQPFISLGNIAATVAEIQAGKAQSAIRSWAHQFKESFEQIVKIYCAWIGVDVEPEVEIDTNFGLTESDVKEAMMLITAFKDGGIDNQQLIDGLTERKLIKP